MELEFGMDIIGGYVTSEGLGQNRLNNSLIEYTKKFKRCCCFVQTPIRGKFLILTTFLLCSAYFHIITATILCYF